MSDQAKTEMSCVKEDRDASWYPLRKWWQSSRLFNQDVGLPPFLEPGDPRWMDVDRLQRSLAAWFWPGYIPAPLFVPYISESTLHPNQRISKWRVSMDVAHFSPAEIFLCVRDGFLEVGGTDLLIKQLQNSFSLLTLLITLTHRTLSSFGKLLIMLSI